MLDVLSYPVSVLLWFWHHMLGLALNPGSGATWALSVVLLVITIRAVLVIPALSQARSMRRMGELQPQLAALRSTYSHDRLELNRRIQRLQQEHGVSALGGCLPVLAQIPLFLGIYHVITAFSSTRLSNGVLDAGQISSFLQARLGGVPLTAYVAMPGDALHALDAGLSRGDVAAVAVPLVLLAAVATHLAARHSARQQSANPAPNELLRKIILWVFPLFPLAGGLFFPFPIAIALYWVTNNVWTLAQNHLVTRHLNAEDARRHATRAADQCSRAPKPGQKPQHHGRRRR